MKPCALECRWTKAVGGAPPTESLCASLPSRWLASPTVRLTHNAVDSGAVRRLGGDCETVGAMAPALAGVFEGIDALPAHARDPGAAANRLNLERRAAALLALRA